MSEKKPNDYQGQKLYRIPLAVSPRKSDKMQRISMMAEIKKGKTAENYHLRPGHKRIKIHF
ncbi:hypothetical protein Q3V30_04490 [Erwinia pyri]|uniref:Uncharacterized protein n=1 Tax=Erwinia pyri TaxID=3062598 RepID=A0AA50DME9_9GAMM|nr:hypothetical protein [Erwinia sp. DE2]WLS79772.1 hypothetical protein Q3V30_04490 [Erwinia sp. DE2]